MQLGDQVKIKECHKIPQLVDEQAEIVAMASQELGEYPVTIKLMTGEHTGKFCGFREEELELLSPDHGIPDVFKQ